MIGNILSLKQLEALVWVADLGSFRKAAHHLGTTQPNISTRIAGIETTLGTTLMHRDAGSIRLTDKGVEILKIARNILREAETLIEIAARPDLIDDRLRLGVTELVACTWLHDFLRRIKQAYPALGIELTVDLSRNLDRELATNSLDLAIQTAPYDTPVTGEIPLGDCPYIWVAKPEIAASCPTKSSVADLIPRTILTHGRDTEAYKELAGHAQTLGVPTASFVSSNSLASCVQMAADGMGVAVLPFALIEKELVTGKLTKLDVDWIPSPLRFAARFQSDRAPNFVIKTAELAVTCAR